MSLEAQVPANPLRRNGLLSLSSTGEKPTLVYVVKVFQNDIIDNDNLLQQVEVTLCQICVPQLTPVAHLSSTKGRW